MGTRHPSFDFDFHGAALDTIFDDYEVMQRDCPVSWSDRYGGFWTITSYADVCAAEHDWDTFSVGPSMILPSFGTDRPLIPLDIDPPALTRFRSEEHTSEPQSRRKPVCRLPPAKKKL